jgi:DNA gyrase subunit B
MFAYDDSELEPLLKKFPNAHVDRNKGLGEMDPDAFAEAAFGPDARLIQFSMEDAAAAHQILETLLGKRNEERTQYIFENIDFSVVDGE